MIGRVAALILLFTTMASAETHVFGYGAVLGRVITNPVNLGPFQSGPISTLSPAIAAGADTSIWKVSVDGLVMLAQTGEKDSFVGPSGSINVVTHGHALTADVGAGWPILSIAGFHTLARAGYGTARVRVPTDVPIQDDRSYWTYGLITSRPVGKRFILRIDVRNLEFRRDQAPQTLGRFNIVVLAGMGLKF